MSPRTLALAFAAFLVAALALLLPLRLLLPTADLRRLDIGAADVRGPVWDARFDDLHWRGQRLGDARVRLQAWPLLAGRRQLVVATDGLSGTLLHGNRNGVAGMQAMLVLDALQDWPGVQARLRLDGTTIVFSEGRCLQAEGAIEAELELPPTLAQGPALVLGGRPTCEDRTVLLQLLPLGDGASPLAGLKVDLRLDADGRYQVHARIAGANPAMAAALQASGFQAGPGGPARIVTGSLVTVP